MQNTRASINFSFNSLPKLIWLLNNSTRLKVSITLTATIEVFVFPITYFSTKHIFWLPSWLLTSLVWQTLVHTKQSRSLLRSRNKQTVIKLSGLLIYTVFKPSDSVLHPLSQRHMVGEYGSAVLEQTSYAFIKFRCAEMQLSAGCKKYSKSEVVEQLIHAMALYYYKSVSSCKDLRRNTTSS